MQIQYLLTICEYNLPESSNFIPKILRFVAYSFIFELKTLTQQNS